MGNFSNKTGENIAQNCNNKVIYFEANNFLHVHRKYTVMYCIWTVNNADSKYAAEPLVMFLYNFSC